MEQNLPIIAKKVWSLMRVFFFILKKGISKTKFFADLNIIIKRGKLAGKALHNLLFHHHHHWAAASTAVRHHPQHLSAHPPTDQYDTYISNHKKHHHPPAADGSDEIVVTPAVMKALEMLASAAASPAVIPGFGKSPRVRQLRITDSPFPLNNGDEDGKVDEAAEKFIMRFYNDLRRQN